MGILFGGILCFSGFIIALLGLSGSIEWIIEATNIKSCLINANPGVFFGFLGTIVLWRYKPTGHDRFSTKHHLANVAMHDEPMDDKPFDHIRRESRNRNKDRYPYIKKEDTGT
jgi:hypothetical protein